MPLPEGLLSRSINDTSSPGRSNLQPPVGTGSALVKPPDPHNDLREALVRNTGTQEVIVRDAGADATTTPASRRERLECLDAVRGLNVIVMMFVDNAGDVDEYWIDHSPWWGIHLADFVMPLFLFMVGVSMAFSMKKYGGPGLKWKVASRTLKLFVLGCLTQGADIFQGGVGIDMMHMRIPGILQRIAWAYCVVSMMKMWLPVYTASRGFVAASIGKWEDAPRNEWAIFSHYALHWLVAFAFFFLYVAIMLFAHVPSWTFVKPAHYDDSPICTDELVNGTKTQVCTANWIPEQVYHTDCDKHGDLTPKCSALRMVDMWLLGPNHMYDGGEFERSHWCSACPPLDDSDGCPLPSRPGWCHARLDPEGVLSSMPTVLTTWLGLHFGLVLVHYSSVVYRLRHWGVLSVTFFALGWAISPFWGFNKQQWSPSYLFFMAGACGFLLIAFYIIYDLKLMGAAASAEPPRWQRCLRVVFMPCRWVGMNTIFIYLLGPSGSVFGDAQRWIYFNGNTKDNVKDLVKHYVFCEHTNDDDICIGHGILNGYDHKWCDFWWIVFRIFAWCCVAGELHRRRWYWAL